MAKLTIRPATVDDIATMAELKSTYVRSLYRGFISQDILHRSTPDFHANTLRAWLESGMYRILQILLIVCAVALCDNDACTGRKSDKKADQQITKRSRRADGRQRLTADITPHNDRVKGGVELLKEVAH